MQNLEEFKRFFQENILPDLKRFEKVRRRFAFMAFAVVSLVILGVYFLACLYRSLPDTFNWIVSLGVILIFGVYYFFNEYYPIDPKQMLTRKIVHFISPSLKYIPGAYIPTSEVINSQIFAYNPEFTYGEYRIKGKINNTEIDLSELYIKFRAKDTQDQDYYTNSFKGLFFIANLNHSFEHTTLILSNRSENIYEGIRPIFHKANMPRPEIVKLNDRSFEKYFTVFSNGTPEVLNTILPADIKQALVHYRRDNNRKLSLSFVQGKVYLALFFDDALMESTVFRSLVDLKPLEKFYDDIRFAVELTENVASHLTV